MCSTTSVPNCTPLAGYWGLEEAIGHLGLNDAKLAIAEVLLASITMGLSGVITDLGISALTARNSRASSVQEFLPSNQWTIEVQNWNEIILANMQRRVLEYATGPSSSEVLPFLTPPNGSSQAHLCGNQRARSGRAQNFSILAIALILGLGLLIICVNLGLHPLVSYVQRERDLKDYRRLAWKTNGLLQLQRLAHEELGFGTWDRCAKAVPVTAKDEVLATLDVTDPEHPVLLRPMVPPMYSSPPSSQTSLTRIGTHANSPQTQSTTSSATSSAEIEAKSTMIVPTTGTLYLLDFNPHVLTFFKSTGTLTPSSSANSTEASYNTSTMQTESLSGRDLQCSRPRRRSV